MKRRDANRVLVGLAAIGGGIVGYSFPLDLLDRVFAASGAASAVPLLAPPLGLAARFLLVGVCAAIAAALAAVALPWKKARPREDLNAQPFFSTLETPDDFIPVLRRSDAHPDAPARSPLFASRDLGHEALPPVMMDRAEDGSPISESMWPDQELGNAEGPDLPPALEPMPWETIQAEMNRLLAGVRFRPLDEESGPALSGEQTPGAGAEGADDPVPSISELIGRLERGIARRRAAFAPEQAAHADGGAPSIETPAAPATDPTTVTGVTVRAG